MPKNKEWRIMVYQGHIGLVDEHDCSMINVCGGRGNLEAWDIANLIVTAVNEKRAREPKDMIYFYEPGGLDCMGIQI